MIIIYTPEDGTPERRFDMRAVRTSEAQIVERTTDMKWSAIKLGVRDDDPTALRGIAWVLLKREQPSLRWSEFDPLTSELASRFDEREVQLVAVDILALPAKQQPQAITELRMYAADPACVDVALKEAAEPPKEATAETSPTDG
ncbi:hypothetical protein ACFVHW_07165 [Streptomyces sp. NPDC127110]|uniref:hypothetical protein n=1 Tax=Streptomyces sp. NPDC127110 TaxID=3345362 RepID=UPI0036443E9C